MLTPQIMADIRESNPFILLLPDMVFEGTEGEAQLRYAMSLGKAVILWRPPTASHRPIPAILATYEDCAVVDGEAEDVMQAVIEFLEWKPGETVGIRDGSW